MLIGPVQLLLEAGHDGVVVTIDFNCPRSTRGFTGAVAYSEIAKL